MSPKCEFFFRMAVNFESSFFSSLAYMPKRRFHFQILLLTDSKTTSLCVGLVTWSSVSKKL